MFVILLVPVASGMTGCSDPVTAVEASVLAEDPIIFEPENWRDGNQLDEFVDPVDFGLAFYARAVADIRQPVPGRPFTDVCTGFLVTDDILVTNRHCTLDMNARVNNIGIPVAFGRFQPQLQQAEIFGLFNDRLGGAANTQQDFVNLTRWQCFYVSSSFTRAEGRRDIHYYRCPPNLVNGIQVLPGHIWGHITSREVTVVETFLGRAIATTAKEGDTIYTLSVNLTSAEVRRGGIGRHVLVSRGGEIYDQFDSCSLSYGDPYENCFETVGDDTLQGSSGGAVLDSDLVLIGVHSGENAPWHDAGSYEPFDPDDGAWNANRAQWITNKVWAEFKNAPPNIERTPSFFPQRTTFWVGGLGGAERPRLGCSAGFLAAGIVGSTQIPAAPTDFGFFVGNFGIVCVPFDTRTPRQMTNAEVFVTGSRDTGFVTNEPSSGLTQPFFRHEPLDFNRYLATVPSVPFETLRRQAFQMCKPPRYLAGVRVAGGRFVNRIERIWCRSPNLPPDNLSFIQVDGIGTQEQGAARDLICPDGFAVAAFDSRSGDWLDRLRLVCVPLGEP